MLPPTNTIAALLFMLAAGPSAQPPEPACLDPRPVESEEQASVGDRVREMCARSADLSNKDFTAALGWARAALTLADAGGGPLERAQAHNAIGLCSSRGGQFAASRDSHRLAREEAQLARAFRELGVAETGLARCALNAGSLELAEEKLMAARAAFEVEGNDRDKAQLHNLFAVLHQSRYQLKDALGEYDVALQHAERAGDLLLQARLHYNLGTIKTNLEDGKGARESIELALELLGDQGDSQFMGLIHSALGMAACEAEDLKAAREWFREGLARGEEAGNKGIAALHLRNLGDMDLKVGRFSQAEQSFRRSLELCRAGPNRESVATSAAKLAETLMALERFDEAVELGVEALEIAGQLDMPYIEKDVTRIMSIVHAGIGEFERALELERQHADITQQIESELRSSETNRLRLEMERSQQEGERLELQRAADERLQRQRLVRNGSVGGALLLLVGLVYVHRSLRQKTRLNQRLEQQNRAILSTNEEVLRLNADLEHTLEEVHRLSGLIPICSHCKSVRDDEGFWRAVESYVSEHSEARFSHGICPGCMKEHYDLERV